jgi:hypothetical protein
MARKKSEQTDMIDPSVIDAQVKANKNDDFVNIDVSKYTKAIPYSQRGPGVKVRPAIRTSGSHDSMKMSWGKGGLRNWRSE